MVSLYAETIDHSSPVSVHGVAVEGMIENTHSNLPFIVECLERSANTVLDMYSMEPQHATQAVDLRKMKQKNVRLSDVTGKLNNDSRAKVLFVEMVRAHSDNLVEGRRILEAF